MARSSVRQNSILGGLDLAESVKSKPVDKAIARRGKLMSKLDEQLKVAEAALTGEDYYSQKSVKKADEDGNQVTVSVPKRVGRWFYSKDGQNWYFEVKYGNRTLELAKGKSAIVVGKLDNMTAVIEQIKQAVVAGELDAAIAAAAERKVAVK